MAQNKKSPYQEGDEAYKLDKKSKNPHVEFSLKWAEWNRGFNKNFLRKLREEGAP